MDFQPSAVKCIKDYHAWMKDKGDAMVLKMLTGVLDAEEKPFEPLLRASALFKGVSKGVFRNPETGANVGPLRRKKKSGFSETEEACIRFAGEIMKRGEQIREKGINGEKLTEEELRVLHMYVIRARLTNGQGWLAPIGNSFFGRKSYTIKHLGMLMPDFRLLKFESALKSPHYTDLFPHNPFIMFEREMDWEYYKNKNFDKYFENKKCTLAKF